MKISVRSGTGSVNSTGEFTDVIEIVDRSPRRHKGWDSVQYKRKRYQLYGGIRTDYFICLNNPIK